MKNRKIVISYGKKNVSILIYLMTLICTFFLTSNPALADLAGFQNGDFSNGFAGWSGDLTYTKNIDLTSDPHFFIIPFGAQIQNDGFDYMVTLYQDFRMTSLNSTSDKIFLNLWLKWAPTSDEQIEGMRARLYAYDPISQQIGSYVNLLQNASMSDLLTGTELKIEVTPFADTPAELAFSVIDTDFNTPDYLTIGNISFTQENTTPIPIPAGWLLLLSGVAFFAAFRKNPRSQLPEN